MVKILWCYHSNETSSVVLSHGAIYFAAFYKLKFGIFVQFRLKPFWEWKLVKELKRKTNNSVFLNYRIRPWWNWDIKKIERMGNQWKYKYWRGFEALELLSFQNKITMKIIQQRKLICIHSFLAYVVHGSVSPYYMLKTLSECYFSSSMEETIHFRARYKTGRKKS